MNNINCELFLNNNKINFCLEYIFRKEEKCKLKILFKNLLKILVLCLMNFLL